MSEDLIGRTIESFRIVSRLGAGGMGEVYLAHDASLDRPVAVKLLAPEIAADPDRLRRFHQEARAASSLNHPHILAEDRAAARFHPGRSAVRGSRAACRSALIPVAVPFDRLIMWSSFCEGHGTRSRSESRGGLT